MDNMDTLTAHTLDVTMQSAIECGFVVDSFHNPHAINILLEAGYLVWSSSYRSNLSICVFSHREDREGDNIVTVNRYAATDAGREAFCGRRLYKLLLGKDAK